MCLLEYRTPVSR